MERRHKGTDKAFEVAMEAYRVEMALSLRSLSAWRSQGGYVILGLLKAASVLLVCVIGATATGLFGSIGPMMGLFMGMLVVPVGVMVFPGWFMHNVFTARAWAAFDAAIERGRT